MLTRAGDRDCMGVYLFVLKDIERHERLKAVYSAPLDQQKKEWAKIFSTAGYESKRIIDGLAGTKDFYAHEVGQVKMQSHHIGHVVLLGDSGYCPSPFTGMGTTLALVGCHILAGELAKHGDDVDGALVAYDQLLRAPVDKYHELSFVGSIRILPTSTIGIASLNFFLWMVSTLRIHSLLESIAAWFPESKDQYVLPKYPRLSSV